MDPDLDAPCLAAFPPECYLLRDSNERGIAEDPQKHRRALENRKLEHGQQVKMNRKIATWATVTVATCAIFSVFYLYGATDILRSIRTSSPEAYLLAFSLLLLNYAIAFLRFLFILNNLSPNRVPWRSAFTAFHVGQVSSVFLFSIVGQSLGRAAMLSRHGVGVDRSVVGTYVERFVATAVLGVCALAATLALFGTLGLQFEGGADYIVAVATALAIAVLTCWLLVLRGRRHWRLCTEIVPNPSLLWPTVLFTVGAQLTMGAAYWVLLTPSIATVDSWQVAAALVIVMFAASLPISFSGWGIRELSAAKALGLIGVAPTAAIAAALLIGTFSLFIPLIAAAVSAVLPGKAASLRPATEAATPVHGVASLALLIGFSAAILVLFQIRIPLENHVATVNLADAVALTALGLVGYMLWRERRRSVVPPALLGALSLISLVIAYSLGSGYLRYGVIDWAWLNRGLGWLVCLGFVSIGPGVATVAGDSARRRVLAVFLVALLTVCVIQLAIYVPASLTLIQISWLQSFQLEGFALNRNAFSFQILIGLIVLWLFLITDIRQQTGRMRWIAAALLFLACYLTLSRAAILTGAGLIVLCSVWTPPNRRHRLWAIAAGLAPVPVFLFALHALHAVGGETATLPMAPLSGGTSDAERWQTIVDGLALWRQHPLFGVGLGGYVQERLLHGESFQVIHNVAVWLLAETGAVGLIATLSGVGWLSAGLWRHSRGIDGAYSRAALLVLATFAAYAMVHDVFAQRVFWFALGLLLAAPPLDERPAV
jgi:uncharacterized membrane protein YbhN (UPF0104 family)